MTSDPAPPPASPFRAPRRSRVDRQTKRCSRSLGDVQRPADNAPTDRPPHGRRHLAWPIGRVSIMQARSTHVHPSSTTHRRISIEPVPRVIQFDVIQLRPTTPPQGQGQNYCCFLRGGGAIARAAKSGALGRRQTRVQIVRS